MLLHKGGAEGLERGVMVPNPPATLAELTLDLRPPPIATQRSLSILCYV